MQARAPKARRRHELIRIIAKNLADIFADKRRDGIPAVPPGIDDRRRSRDEETEPSLTLQKRPLGLLALPLARKHIEGKRHISRRLFQQGDLPRTEVVGRAGIHVQGADRFTVEVQRQGDRSADSAPSRPIPPLPRRGIGQKIITDVGPPLAHRGSAWSLSFRDGGVDGYQQALQIVIVIPRRSHRLDELRRLIDHADRRNFEPP